MPATQKSTTDRGLAPSRDNLGFELAKASQRWNQLLAAGFEEHGFGEVRPAFGSVLLPLFEEDGLRLGEVGRRARLSKQTMTTLVRRVEAAGLVRREPDPVDGRAQVVRLTERARELAPVAAEVVGGLEEAVGRLLGPGDERTVRDALRAIAEL